MITKTDIITRIKEIAKNNGGTPPGKKVFINQTGISEYEYGRYWPTWGDALIESGFTPNKMNEAIPDEILIKRIAELILDLGHFPSNAEIRIRSMKDQCFPSPKVFDRFGGRSELAKKVLESHTIVDGNKLIGTSCEAYIAKRGKSIISDTVISGSEKSNSLPQDFFSLIEYIRQWTPSLRRNSEESYKVELRNHLCNVSRCSGQVREEKGDSNCDIVVKDKYGIETKKNPGQSDYDRCFGQIARHLNHFDYVIVVIFDVPKMDQWNDFCKLVDAYYNDKCVLIKKCG